jgi:Na+/proline symporter
MAVLHMPFIFGALILCACVAFLVTTGDSFLLSTATNIMLDVVQKYFKPGMTDKQWLLSEKKRIKFRNGVWREAGFQAGLRGALGFRV